MSVVVEVTIPAESFALAHALDAVPSTTVEAERVASHSPEWALPFLWVSSDEFDAFHEELGTDPSVESASVVERAGAEVLCKVEWGEEFLELIADIINQHAIILEATARACRWQLRFRFAKQEQVSSFREHFAERGRQFEIRSLHHPSAPRQREFGLTEEQRETLVRALRMGYFEVPRDNSIEDLADALGVSSNAVSQRVRRGSANLVQHTLVIGTEE